MSNGQVSMLSSFTYKVVYNINTENTYIWSSDVNNEYRLVFMTDETERYAGYSSYYSYVWELDSNGELGSQCKLEDEFEEFNQGGIFMPKDDSDIYATDQLIDYILPISSDSYGSIKVDAYKNAGSTLPDEAIGRTDGDSKMLNPETNMLYRLCTINSTEYLAVSSWNSSSVKFTYKTKMDTDMTYGAQSSWLFNKGANSYLVREVYDSSSSRFNNEVCLIEDSGLTKVGTLQINGVDENANTNLTTISHSNYNESNPYNSQGIRRGFTYGNGAVYFIYSREILSNDIYSSTKTLAYSTDFNTWNDTEISLSKSGSQPSMGSESSMGFIVIQ